MRAGNILVAMTLLALAAGVATAVLWVRPGPARASVVAGPSAAIGPASAKVAPLDDAHVGIALLGLPPSATLTSTPTPTNTATPTPTPTKPLAPKLSLDVTTSGTARGAPPTGGAPPIDISGGWDFDLGSGLASCFVAITQTDSNLDWEMSCHSSLGEVDVAFIESGTIDTTTGEFSVSGTLGNLSGVASQDGNSMTSSNGTAFTGTRVKSAPVGDCTTVSGELACDVLNGKTATITVSLDELNLPDLDGDTAAGYTGFQLRLSSNTVILWPDCDPDTLAQQGNLISCTVGPGAEESTYLGAIAQLDFTCSQGGVNTFNLEIGIPSDSHLLDEDGNEVLPAKADSVRINCLLPTPTPTAPTDLDSDGDGCTDTQEQGSTAVNGGLRDPLNFWDFFDTPNPNRLPQRDKFINVADIARVVARFGTSGDPGIDPLSTPPKDGYHTAYDRFAVEGKLSGPADGFIGAGDILLVVLQFGHTCLP